MAAAVRGGCRQQLLGLRGFLYSDCRNYAVLGLGRLQLGELPPKKTVPEWVPPPDDPLPHRPPRNRGGFLRILD